MWVVNISICLKQLRNCNIIYNFHKRLQGFYNILMNIKVNLLTGKASAKK